MPVPGGNLFIATQDLTSAADENGDRAIMCTSITGSHAAKTASSGLRLLLRLLTAIDE